MLPYLHSSSGRLIVFLLVTITVSQSFHIIEKGQELQGDELLDHDDNIGQLHEPRTFDSIQERSLEARIDLGGFDIDGVADDVYGKVSSKVQGAVNNATKGLQNTVDDAKNGLEGIFDAAKKGIDDAISAAKKVLEDIKEEVEKLYEQVKAKVAEFEKELSEAVKKWVWEHIGKPLLTLAIIILAPILLMILWWFLHLLCKIYLRLSKKKEPSAIEMQFRYQSDGNHSSDQTRETSDSMAKRVAELIVSGWENYGQGLICLICPWYASYVLWREKKRVRKDLAKLRRDVDDLYKNQYWQGKNTATKEAQIRI
ncbi:hypothetical protein F5Y15DRAFT_417035 [Xylariaceae sp. FL0016]|nr:hypothetical protein F5Y15DRAFT_417035 [Xylariaceae sp. FL0016]